MQPEQRMRKTLGALVAMAEAMVQTRPIPRRHHEDGSTVGPFTSTTPLFLMAQRLAELTQRVLGCWWVGTAAVDARTGQLYPVTQVSLGPDEHPSWWASWSPPQRLEERYDPAIAALLRAGASTGLSRWK
jgi:hypothetical protein